MDDLANLSGKLLYMDVFDKKTRSGIMAKVKGKNTKPELAVRSLLHSMGFRFRLHRKDLPGKPDLVLPRYHVALFVHGCFWHGHTDCPRSAHPTSNTEFWTKKLNGNRDRDKRDFERLIHLGWRVIVVWECEIKNVSRLREVLSNAIKCSEQDNRNGSIVPA